MGLVPTADPIWQMGRVLAVELSLETKLGAEAAAVAAEKTKHSGALADLRALAKKMGVEYQKKLM